MKLGEKQASGNVEERRGIGIVGGGLGVGGMLIVLALQKQTQGRVVPEPFTHGSSEQRVRWFKRGPDSGSPKDCDTFSIS